MNAKISIYLPLLNSFALMASLGLTGTSAGRRGDSSTFPSFRVVLRRGELPEI
jgi:hypothetical protein